MVFFLFHTVVILFNNYHLKSYFFPDFLINYCNTFSHYFGFLVSVDFYMWRCQCAEETVDIAWPIQFEPVLDDTVHVSTVKKCTKNTIVLSCIVPRGLRRLAQ